MYGIAEAARFLGIKPSTLRSWTRGRDYPTASGAGYFAPLIELADPVGVQLSFANMAEAHLLQATRDHDIRYPNVRAAIDYVRQNMPSPHPLLTADFHHFGKELFIKHLEGTPVNASKNGQRGLREVLEGLLERLERDQDGNPIKIFPVRTERIVLDIRVAAGQPTVKGTRIPAKLIWRRRMAGDSVEKLAQGYGIPVGDVEEAIKHFDAA